MKYVYKIIDDHYYEMGGEPYEYGEYELASFVAKEVKPLLFEKVVPVVRDQTDKKEWQYLANRLRCRIYRGEDLIATYHVDHEGRLTGDDGPDDGLDDEGIVAQAAPKALSPEYNNLIKEVKAGNRNKPSAAAIKAARQRLAPPKIETDKRSANGGQKGKASKGSNNNNSTGTGRRKKAR